MEQVKVMDTNTKNRKFMTISKERTGGGLNKGAIFSAPLFSTLSVFPN